MRYAYNKGVTQSSITREKPQANKAQRSSPLTLHTMHTYHHNGEEYEIDNVLLPTNKEQEEDYNDTLYMLIGIIPMLLICSLLVIYLFNN